MKCATHSEIEATAFCRECGTPMCGECQRPAMGSVYCATHFPALASAPPPLPVTPAPYPQPAYAVPQSPYTSPVAPVKDSSVHPVLAAFLGFIPGVGAIYNGQYAKGLVHAVVFGLLITLIERARGGTEPLFGIMVAAWVFYQVFEAYHTARKRRHGIAVEEFSSLIDVRTSQNSRFPTGAVVLIVVGFIMLLNTTDLIDFAVVERYWPVGLIGLGGYLLYNRTTRPAGDSPAGDSEVRQ